MKLNPALNRKDASIVKRFETDHARLIPSVEDAETMYVELDGIRLIFRDGRYDGFYRP